ncbi:IucA/IucC family C-terminal-domain containing protein [Paenibacillaceae bacterium WGS1546]|uniref:IucA/IucC family C-terminal-domain containing protein n=1 Tax=Cohnella sp. WGS1546 TaxID=3366810 RepID=UPI00372D5CF2
MIVRSGFTPAEKEQLAASFSLLADPPSDARNRMPCLDLLDETRCAAYLDGLAGTLPSPSRLVAASQFSKRYAFIAAVPSLYAMTAYGKGMLLSIEDCSLDASPDRIGQSRLTAGKLLVTEPKAGERDRWRAELTNRLFAGHLARIWRTVSAVAGIPKAILWENAAVRVYSLYEKRIPAEADEKTRLRLAEDFDYLVRRAPGSAFGEKFNPLARFFGDRRFPGLPSEAAATRIRRTCCFYYQAAPDAEYCSTCPKTKTAKPEVARERKR